MASAMTAFAVMLLMRFLPHVITVSLQPYLRSSASICHLSFKAHCEKVTPIIYEIVQRHQGSISAEHGVGLLKKPYLSYTRSQVEIAAMRGIKAVFDPDGIMNPNKIFDL